MKILLIGGTGRISMAISRQLLAEGHDLYLINRGSRSQELEQGLERRPIYLTGDVRDEAQMASLLNGLSFDAVADFIAFDQSDLERDYRLFSGKTHQFLYISSASAYQKPLSHYQITESTPLANPFWEYSRKKIQGEEYLMNLYPTPPLNKLLKWKKKFYKTHQVIHHLFHLFGTFVCGCFPFVSVCIRLLLGGAACC